MSKIIFLSISLFFSVANAKGKSDIDELTKICDKDPQKKSTQYEANKKQIVSVTKKITSDRGRSNFENTPMYEWARFASPESIGKLLNPIDKDKCVKHYQMFIATKEQKASEEKLELWRACIISDYRDSIPQMAKNLLECHGAKSTNDEEAETKSPPEEN